MQLSGTSPRTRRSVNYPGLKSGACEEMYDLLHIRAVDAARHSGDGAPEALMCVADVPRRHEVCVPFVATPDASERALRPAILWVDQAAVRTPSAGVFRIDLGDLDAPERRLVGDKRAEACEAPRVEPPAVLPSSRFGVVPDAGQVLEDERVAGAHRPDQPLREDVIAVAAETCQTVVEATKVPLGRSGAFALEPTAKREQSFFDGSPARIAEEGSITGYGGTLDAAINADDLSRLLNIGHLLLDDDMQEPALGLPDEISGAGLESLKSLGVYIEEDRNLDPPSDHSEAGRPVPIEPVRAGVESNGGFVRPWAFALSSSPYSLADGFERLDGFHASRDHKLTGKASLLSDRIVSHPVYLDAVCGTRIPSGPGGKVECVRVLPNRMGEPLALGGVNDELEPDGLRDDHLPPSGDMLRPLDVSLDCVCGDLSCRPNVEGRSPEMPLPENLRQMRELAEERAGRNALEPLDRERWGYGGRGGVEEMHMVGLDFEGQNLETLGLRDFVEHAPEPVGHVLYEDLLPVLRNPDGVVGGLVDGVAGALDSEFHTCNSLPHSHRKSTERRFLPALKGGVSAPKML